MMKRALEALRAAQGGGYEYVFSSMTTGRDPEFAVPRRRMPKPGESGSLSGSPLHFRVLQILKVCWRRQGETLIAGGLPGLDISFDPKVLVAEAACLVG